MKRLKKIIAVLLTLTMMLGTVGLASYAATLKKIPTVSLTFESEIKVGTSIDNDNIHISAKSGNYSLGDIEILNEGFEWGENDIPKVRVYLYANDGYYFSVQRASGITLKGATYDAARKENSSQTLILTVLLDSLAESVGEIEQVTFADSGLASWSEGYGADSYEVKLYRDGRSVGVSKIVAGTSYSFAPIMTKAATYSVKVRAINRVKSDIRGPWAESSPCYVDGDLASVYREQYGTKQSGVEEPGQLASSDSTVGTPSWQQDEKGWWYVNADGSYTRNNWQLINQTWYFFHPDGYMATGWVDWNGKWYFCDETGAMLVGTQTPDGYQVDGSGVMIH